MSPQRETYLVSARPHNVLHHPRPYSQTLYGVIRLSHYSSLRCPPRLPRQGTYTTPSLHESTSTISKILTPDISIARHAYSDRTCASQNVRLDVMDTPVSQIDEAYNFSSPVSSAPIHCFIIVANKHRVTGLRRPRHHRFAQSQACRTC